MGEVRRSAAHRIAFATAAAFAVTILLLGAAIFLTAHREFGRQLDRRLMDESAELLDGRGPGGLGRAIAERDSDAPVNAFGYALFDREGQRVAGALRTARPAPGLRTIGFTDPREGEDTARALATRLADGRTLVVALDGEPLERVDATILSLFGGALVVVLLVSAGGALVLGATLRRRLDPIGDTAQAIAAGELDRRVPVGARGDEFDRLATSLNAMLDRIVRLMDNLRQLSGDVAHDLRTPLSRLRGGLEAALDGPAEDQHRALGRALEQSDELLSLFAAILRISEVEAGRLRAGFERVDVGQLAHELCDSFAPAMVDGGRALACSAAPSLFVSGDRTLLAQAIVNLLDNAQGHTPSGTAITFSVEDDGANARLMVADDGPGVPTDARGRITQRFVRLDPSRSAPGHGLGLNLVDAVARLHCGTVEITDNAPGLRVTLRLPRVAA